MEFLARVLSGSGRLKERAKDVEDVEKAFKANLESIQTVLEQDEPDIVDLIEMIYDSSFPEEQMFLKNPLQERIKSHKQLVSRLVSGLGSQGVPVMPLLLEVLHKHGVESVASILVSLLGLLSPLLASKEVPDFTSDDVLDAMDFNWQTSIGSPLLSTISSTAASPRASAESKIDSPMNSPATYSKSYSDRSFLRSPTQFEQVSKRKLDKPPQRWLTSVPVLRLDGRKSPERKFLDPEIVLSDTVAANDEAPSRDPTRQPVRQRKRSLEILFAESANDFENSTTSSSAEAEGPSSELVANDQVGPVNSLVSGPAPQQENLYSSDATSGDVPTRTNVPSTAEKPSLNPSGTKRSRTRSRDEILFRQASALDTPMKLAGSSSPVLETVWSEDSNGFTVELCGNQDSNKAELPVQSAAEQSKPQSPDRQDSRGEQMAADLCLRDSGEPPLQVNRNEGGSTPVHSVIQDESGAVSATESGAVSEFPNGSSAGAQGNEVLATFDAEKEEDLAAVDQRFPLSGSDTPVVGFPSSLTEHRPSFEVEQLSLLERAPGTVQSALDNHCGDSEEAIYIEQFFTEPKNSSSNFRQEKEDPSMLADSCFQTSQQIVRHDEENQMATRSVDLVASPEQPHAMSTQESAILSTFSMDPSPSLLEFIPSSHRRHASFGSAIGRSLSLNPSELSDLSLREKSNVKCMAQTSSSSASGSGISWPDTNQQEHPTLFLEATGPPPQGPASGAQPMAEDDPANEAISLALLASNAQQPVAIEDRAPEEVGCNDLHASNASLTPGAQPRDVEEEAAPRDVEPEEMRTLHEAEFVASDSMRMATAELPLLTSGIADEPMLLTSLPSCPVESKSQSFEEAHPETSEMALEHHLEDGNNDEAMFANVSLDVPSLHADVREAFADGKAPPVMESEGQLPEGSETKQASGTVESSDEIKIPDAEGHCTPSQFELSKENGDDTVTEEAANAFTTENDLSFAADEPSEIDMAKLSTENEHHSGQKMDPEHMFSALQLHRDSDNPECEKRIEYEGPAENKNDRIKLDVVFPDQEKNSVLKPGLAPIDALYSQNPLKLPVDHNANANECDTAEEKADIPTVSGAGASVDTEVRMASAETSGDHAERAIQSDNTYVSYNAVKEIVGVELYQVEQDVQDKFISGPILKTGFGNQNPQERRQDETFPSSWDDWQETRFHEDLPENRIHEDHHQASDQCKPLPVHEMKWLRNTESIQGDRKLPNGDSTLPEGESTILHKKTDHSEESYNGVSEAVPELPMSLMNRANQLTCNAESAPDTDESLRYADLMKDFQTLAVSKSFDNSESCIEELDGMNSKDNESRSGEIADFPIHSVVPGQQGPILIGVEDVQLMAEDDIGTMNDKLEGEDRSMQASSAVAGIQDWDRGRPIHIEGEHAQLISKDAGIMNGNLEGEDQSSEASLGSSGIQDSEEGSPMHTEGGDAQLMSEDVGIVYNKSEGEVRSWIVSLAVTGIPDCEERRPIDTEGEDAPVISEDVADMNDNLEGEDRLWKASPGTIIADDAGNNYRSSGGDEQSWKASLAMDSIGDASNPEADDASETASSRINLTEDPGCSSLEADNLAISTQGAGFMYNSDAINLSSEASTGMNFTEDVGIDSSSLEANDQLLSKGSPGINSVGGPEPSSLEADQESSKGLTGKDLAKDTAINNHLGADEQSPQVSRGVNAAADTQMGNSKIYTDRKDSPEMDFTGDGSSIGNSLGADDLLPEASSEMLASEGDGPTSDNPESPDALPGGSTGRSSSETPSEASSAMADDGITKMMSSSFKADDQLSSEASPGMKLAGGTEINNANLEPDQESSKASTGIDLEEETAISNILGADEQPSEVFRVMDIAADTQMSKSNFDTNHKDPPGVVSTGDGSLDNILEPDNLPSKASPGTLVADYDGLLNDNSETPDMLPGAFSERSSSGSPSEASSIVANASGDDGMVSNDLGAEELSRKGSSSVLDSRTDVGSDQVAKADELVWRADCGADDDGNMENKRDVGMEREEEEGGGVLEEEAEKDDREGGVVVPSNLPSIVPSNIPSESSNVEVPSPYGAQIRHAVITGTRKDVDNRTLLQPPHEWKAISPKAATSKIGRLHNGDKTNLKAYNNKKNNKKFQARKFYRYFCFCASSTHT